MAKYIEKLVGPDERIIFETHLHWIVYFIPFVLMAIGLAGFSVIISSKGDAGFAVLCFLLLPVGILLFFWNWIRRATTEIAVTTRRIVYKRGLLSRNTIEINFNRIESLDIKQSVLGRIFDFGTVIIRGTGIGVQPMHDVAAPLKLRNATFGQHADDLNSLPTR